MATIHVDGKTYEVNGADNLLQACLSMGLDIPYFCWHPALDSVGACRQCAVKQYKDADDKNGRIVMSCMTPATDNTWISIADDEAKEFRESIVSLLMTNHPHDCPVCEEGGHCHLQDMTVMTGHHSREYRFTKRTHQNQYLGPFIGHEMNRCISCYRCVRYYKDYAGGKDLGVYGAAANVYFGRPEDGVLESEFSGNLTEVCPTGVFTDKTHSEHYTRKWDMQFSPAICNGCAVGCNISPGERYGEVRRIENRYHSELNGYFLCDRGRFGYGHVNRQDRPRHALIRRENQWMALEPTEALAQAKAILGGGKPVIGIGSPRATLEANHALRTLVGAENFYSGMAAQDAALTARLLEILRSGPVAAATIQRIEQADAVLVLGEDTLGTAPRVALALRQAARGKLATMSAEKKVPEWQAASALDIAQHALNPLFIATPVATKLDEIASGTLRASANGIAAFAQAIAHALDASAADATVDADTAAQVQQVVAALKAAKKPLVVSGTGCGSLAVLEAAANVAIALAKLNPDTAISLAAAEVNSVGLAMMQAPDLDAALKRVSGGEAVVIVLENDLSRRASADVLDAALTKARVIAIDHQQTATTATAALVLPAASFAEGDGTYVNFEGRAQRSFQTFDPAYYDRHVAIRESWRWLAALRDTPATTWNTLDDVITDLAVHQPVLAGIVDAAPNAQFRIDGAKLARAPQRQSGRTAARADVFVHEPKATPDPDTPLAFSMEGINATHNVERPAALIPFAWSPGWNSPSAWNKFQQEVGGPLKGGDAGVRLFGHNGARAYFPATPEGANGLTVQPLHHHFGGDELSSKAAPIQERIPQAYVALNVADAQRLGIEHQAFVRLEMGKAYFTLPAKVRMDIPRGVVGLPVGLAGVPPVVAGATISVSKGG
jgi:NADH-quinone oxidoreductase subunit G